MNQRRDTYRAALQRDTDTAAPRRAAAPPHSSVTRLDLRYVRVTIELDPAVPREVTRWVGPPVSALMRVGAAVLRPLTGTA
ncbi:hypothetical protein [Streptomyces sp. M41(2017)]|uniref:hypothetical protein n=1 Tax=unclassified Streptomyces TaxID=2593676 RepID=UPI0009BD4926|nr:hypothetical protein [Streptomyces sp. M41(2017)]OQQ14113.1 hypothetical protein B0675_28460 [Streptomyces sp. M41(2017)]